MYALKPLKLACTFAQSDQSSLSQEETLHSWLSKMRRVKIPSCAVWSESSLGAHVQRYLFWCNGSMAQQMTLQTTRPCLVICLIISVNDWRRWPDGDYAILESIYGCPDPDVNIWEHGYMNISFEQPHNLQQPGLEDILDHNSSKLLGPLSQNRIQLNFCARVANTLNAPSTTTSEWPRGKYSVYRTGNDCPEGRILRNMSRSVRNVHLVMCTQRKLRSESAKSESSQSTLRYLRSLAISSGKHAYIILTPINPICI